MSFPIYEFDPALIGEIVTVQIVKWDEPNGHLIDPKTRTSHVGHLEGYIMNERMVIFKLTGMDQVKFSRRVYSHEVYKETIK